MGLGKVRGLLVGSRIPFTILAGDPGEERGGSISNPWHPIRIAFCDHKHRRQQQVMAGLELGHNGA